MGSCNGRSTPVSAEERQAIEKSRSIEGFLKEEAKKASKTRKLLLLGAGDSGKTTFLRQIRYIHREPFHKVDRLNFREIVRENIMTSMRGICQAIKRLGLTAGVPLDPFLSSGGVSFSVSPEMRELIKALWNDPATAVVLERISEFQISQNILYYMQEFDRIMEEDYEPTDLDIFYARSRTTGIVELEFTYNSSSFVLVDVGGQRSERKKWIHCFQDVSCVLFCASLAEFEQKLVEDESVNRMKESLELFEELANSHWFRQTPLVLLLNKRDILLKRIHKSDLAQCFPDWKYGTEGSFEDAIKFIEGKFLELNRNPDRPVYVHVTCALETKNIKQVFTAIYESLLALNLSLSGISL